MSQILSGCASCLTNYASVVIQPTSKVIVELSDVNGLYHGLRVGELRLLAKGALQVEVLGFPDVSELIHSHSIVAGGLPEMS